MSDDSKFETEPQLREVEAEKSNEERMRELLEKMNNLAEQLKQWKQSRKTG